MQSVILAAGNSTRTYPLTLTKPKPLLKIANRTVLEYNLEAVKDTGDEIIIVVGYKKDMLKDFIQKNYPQLKIKFVEQKEQLGTGNAVSILEKHIKNRFILFMGDNICSRKDVNEIANDQYAILVKKVKNPEFFGVVIEKNSILADIIEKPKKFASDSVNCALYSLDKKIFDILKKTEKSERGEYELTEAIKLISANEKVYCVKSASCLLITRPWYLLNADKELRRNKNIIGKNSKIQGKQSFLVYKKSKGFLYICGNVKNSSIGDNCVIIGTIKNSIIMGNTIIDKGSIVEDSIIGENVYFKGTIIAKNNIYSNVRNKKIRVDRLGAVISDNVKAENVIINAGCKIWPNKKIKGEIDHDIG